MLIGVCWCLHCQKHCILWVSSYKYLWTTRQGSWEMVSGPAEELEALLTAEPSLQLLYFLKLLVFYRSHRFQRQNNKNACVGLFIISLSVIEHKNINVQSWKTSLNKHIIFHCKASTCYVLWSMYIIITKKKHLELKTDWEGSQYWENMPRGMGLDTVF